jgi:hypothetical protein
MEYRVKDKYSEWHVQCNSIVIITLKKAGEQAKAELKVESGYVDLFGMDSSQSQRSNNNPPSPPPQHRKRCLEKRHEVGDDNEDGGNNGRGGGRGGRE